MVFEDHLFLTGRQNQLGILYSLIFLQYYNYHLCIQSLYHLYQCLDTRNLVDKLYTTREAKNDLFLCKNTSTASSFNACMVPVLCGLYYYTPGMTENYTWPGGSNLRRLLA